MRVYVHKAEASHFSVYMRPTRLRCGHWTNIYIYMCVYMYIYLWIYGYVCIYIYAYVYIYMKNVFLNLGLTSMCLGFNLLFFVLF